VVLAILSGASTACANSPDRNAAPPEAPALIVPQTSANSPGTSETPCPSAADFASALAESVSADLLAPIEDSQMDSDIACARHVAAAWIKLRQLDRGKEVNGRAIFIVRWRCWRLQELNMAYTDADKRWELMDYHAKFSASASVCEQSPILTWLQSQGSCVS
jgi:hypothetical protein